MALGFRECCNQYSYFLLNTTPSFVSEFETYYIITEQGLNFCAVYVNLPTLNYNPPTYSLSEMTQQTNCAVCIVNFPCAAQEVILVNEFVSGSVAQGTDCQVTTIPPMFVACQTDNPTTFGGEDGRVSLVVSGAVAPYRFISAGTQSFLSYTQPEENVYTIFNAVPAGQYNIIVQDSNLDFSITGTCVLENPPSILVVEAIVTPVTFNGASDGIVEIVFTNGVPPYTVRLDSQVVGQTITGLAAGIYFFEVSDQVFSQILTVEVTQPAPINYTPGICFTFSYCGTIFNLNFFRLPAYENLRPRYRCSNPTKIGLKELYIRWNNEEPAGWVTTVETPQLDDIQFDIFPGNCNFGDGRFLATGPSTEQPTGPWIGGGMIQGIFPVATPGGCPPTVIVREPIGTYCPGPPVSLAEVILEGAGGSGGPYTFFYSTNGVNYTESSVGTLYLTNGVYSAKVRDSDGIESLPVNFTVITEVNTFRGSQIGFCGIIDPASPGVTGVLDRAINEGEYREVEFTVTHFFDFSTMPEGTVFSGQFNMNITNSVVSGDFGNGPIEKTEFLFDVLEAYYVNSGTRTDFKSQLALGSNPFNFPDPNDILGSQDLYSVNFGVYSPPSFTDNCTASTVNPTRTSPNYWYACDGLYNSSSLIEGDTRDRNYSNFYSLRAPVATFTTESRIAIKMKIRMRSSITPYIPEFFNETDATTLAPEFHTPEGALLLNQPNTSNQKSGGDDDFFVNYSFNSLTLLQSPPSIRCFRLENNFSSFGRAQIPGTNSFQTRLYFKINSSYSVNEPFSANETTTYVNRILALNNTCASPPDWSLI